MTKKIDLEHESIRCDLRELDKKIDKRPTFKQVVAMASIGIGAAVALFSLVTNHLLNGQSRYLNAETKVIVAEAIEKHDEKTQRTWVAKKAAIIQEILAKVIKTR